MRVIHYQTVKASSQKQLEDIVNSFIGGAWQPLGGMAVTTSLLGVKTYYQAVVKTE